MDIGRRVIGSGPRGPWGLRSGFRVDLDRLCRWSWIIRAWMILAVIWSLGVAGYFLKEVRDQVLANDEIATELAQLDCPSGGSCAAPPAGGGASFRQVATTFLTFGFRPLLEALTGPPAALFLLGCASVAVRRRRLPVPAPGETPESGDFLPLAYEGVEPAE